MLRPTPLARFTVPAAVLLTAGLAIPALHAAADPTAAEQCVQAGNVWVHVEYDDTVTGACATEFASAQEAVLSAGVTTDEGWIQTVDGRLAENQEWWSVFFLSPNEDGTYPSEWDFAQVGVGELEMFPYEVLGLKLQADWELDSELPAVNPVEGVVLVDEDEDAEPTPAPSPSPSPSPTVSQVASPAPVVTEPAVSPSPTAPVEATIEPTATAAPARPGLPSTGN